jgi:hypothetical protein
MYKLNNFLRLIFRDSFTEIPKRYAENNSVVDMNTLGWSHIGFVSEPRSKEVKFSNAVRTFKSFDYYKDDELAVYFTPNTFSSRKHRDSKHLRWINCIAIDIDDPTLNVIDILFNVSDAELPEPTAINKTPKGFHVYWVLDERVPATDKAKYLVDLINNGIMKSMGADPNAVGCTRLFRIPKDLYFLKIENTYSLKEFQTWYHKKISKPGDKKNTDNLIKNKRTGLLNSEAVQTLLQGVEEGNRNTALYCLAKVYKAENMSMDEAINELVKWNSSNDEPLSYKEVLKTIKSAYKTDYAVPTKKITELTGIEFNAYNFWYKHKKARKDRIRNHYEEWAEDITEYLSANGGEFEGSQKELAKALNAPVRSIKEVLKMIRNGEMKSNIHISVDGKGRGARTILKLVVAEPININKGKKKIFHDRVIEDKCTINKHRKVVGATSYNKGSP